MTERPTAAMATSRNRLACQPWTPRGAVMVLAMLSVLLVAPPVMLGAERTQSAPSFLEAHCTDCHDPDTKQGGLDLTALRFDPADPKNAAAWVTIHDRVRDGEMPPAKRKARPGATELD